MSNGGRIDLSVTQAAGNGLAKKFIGGGKALFAAVGTFGTNALLQQQMPDDTWVTVPSTTLTADGMANVDLPPGQVRVVVAGGGSSITSWLIAIPK